MPRRYNIRWSQSDEAELKRVVKNFNAKVSRVAAKDPKNKSALPEKVSAAQLREMIETRQDLNRELNALRRFSERGAEEIIELPDNDYNLRVTKWQKKEMTRLETIVNQKRRKQLERVANIELTDRGKSLGYTKGERDQIDVAAFDNPESYAKGRVGMRKIEEVELYPVQAFTSSQNRRDLNARFAQLKKESVSTYWDKRNEIMRTNYLREIERNFPGEMVSEVVDKIRNMEFDEFRKVFEAEDQHKFQFNYPLNKDDQTKYSNALRAIWIPNK